MSDRSLDKREISFELFLFCMKKNLQNNRCHKNTRVKYTFISSDIFFFCLFALFFFVSFLLLFGLCLRTILEKTYCWKCGCKISPWILPHCKIQSVLTIFRSFLVASFCFAARQRSLEKSSINKAWSSHYGCPQWAPPVDPLEPLTGGFFTGQRGREKWRMF